LQTLSYETDFRRTHKNLEARYLSPIDFADCPVEATLGVLGRKWSIVIIRDIGVYGRERFNQLLKSLPGISPRVLATRLKQLEDDGIVKKFVEKSKPPKIVRWSLTDKGLDALRVGMMVASFGARWQAERVFFDKMPRTTRELYNREGMELLKRDF
jgi:DNA-binding HxlR family transcriptional regulator